jgi:phospholipase/carboxylesterase
VLKTFEIEPTAPQRGSVIWLHGLGASNHDFESIVPELAAPSLRFVFPAAPIRKVTINEGMSMPAWYDILSFADPPLRERESDVREAAREIEALIEREHERGVRYQDIVLAGFSQGGAMVLHVGTRFAHTLAGVLVLSGYLLLPDRLREERAEANLATPILMAHGRGDPVVPEFLAKKGHDVLEAAGHTLDYRLFDMGHSMCLEEVELIAGWLETRFAPES